MDNDLISRSASIDALLKQPNTPTPSVIRRVLRQVPEMEAVVLPVRPGQAVWILNHKFAAEIEEICVREDGVFAVWTEYERGPELTEVWDDGEFDLEEIGKTVFLTVEEWEKAMAKGWRGEG